MLPADPATCPSDDANPPFTQSGHVPPFWLSWPSVSRGCPERTRADLVRPTGEVLFTTRPEAARDPPQLRAWKPGAVHRRSRSRYRHGGPWARSRGRRAAAALAIAVGVVLTTTVVAWAVDTKVHDSQAGRGVTLEGRGVSSETREQLRDEAASVSRDLASVPVRISAPSGNLDTNLGDLGISLDEDAAVAKALSRDGDEPLIIRPFTWVKALFVPMPVPLSFRLDQARSAERLSGLQTDNSLEPVEPAFTTGGDKASVTMTPGKAGRRIDPDAVTQDVLRAAGSGQRTIFVEVKPQVTQPRFSDADGQKLLDQANKMTKKSVSIYLGGKSIRVDTKTLLTWLKIGPGTGGTVDVQIDEAKVAKDVPKLLGVSGTPVTQISFGLGFDGTPLVVDGKPGTRCCTPESIQKIPAALEAGQQRVDLEMAAVQPDHDRAWAEGLGISARVADFTTPHPCCEPRVTNIHTIADAVRGAVIAPGETFSLNGFVGQRTKEKGYVEAPVIYDGSHDVDVGGGVSQFATTLFNAAFFAGLDIPAYQMHSLYISRYPYGREATVSWDKPDLKITNSTPFGIMVWTSYTDTSITIAMYSTPWVKGDQTNQVKEPKGPCTKVTTERTRTFLIDNHTEVDRFNALYQPADGVKC